MNDEILDEFSDFEDQFEAGTKVVVAKFFYFESQARLYAARLKEAGIKSFISNANTISVIPLGEGGIGLHVKETDLTEALSIIRKMDQMNVRENTNQSFHDADAEDIAYEQAIHQEKNRKAHPAIIVMLLIILLAFLHAILRNAPLF